MRSTAAGLIPSARRTPGPNLSRRIADRQHRRPRWPRCGPATRTTRACRSRTRSTGRSCPTLDSLAVGTPLQIYAELTLDVSFTIAVRAGYRRRRCAHRRGVPGRRRAGQALARRASAESRTGAGQFECRGRAGRRRRAGGRRGQHRAGHRALRAGRRWRQTSSTSRTRAPGSCSSAVPARPPKRTGADRTSVVLRLDNVPGALVVGDDRARHARHRPDPHRVQADPYRAGHLHVLPRLRRAHRRRLGRRGTAGAAPTLCRRAVSGLVADRRGGRCAAAADGRGDGVAGAPAGGPRRERPAGTGAARPDARQRRPAARHPAAGSRTDRSRPRAGAGVRAGADPSAGAARAFDRDPGGPDGRPRSPPRSPRPATGTSSRVIHEVQVGDLENRNDEAAHDEFNAVYRRWHEGELDVALPGGETGHDRCSTATCRCSTSYGCATSTTPTGTGDIVVVSHGAAIRLVSAVLAGVDGALRRRSPPGQHRVGGAGPDHRRPLELRAVGHADPAVRPRGAVSSGVDRAAVNRPDGLRQVRRTRTRRSCSRCWMSWSAVGDEAVVLGAFGTADRRDG